MGNGDLLPGKKDPERAHTPSQDTPGSPPWFAPSRGGDRCPSRPLPAWQPDFLRTQRDRRTAELEYPDLRLSQLCARRSCQHPHPHMEPPVTSGLSPLPRPCLSPHWPSLEPVCPWSAAHTWEVLVSAVTGVPCISALWPLSIPGPRHGSPHLSPHPRSPGLGGSSIPRSPSPEF